MTAQVDRLTEEALKLPADERLQLVAVLMESVDDGTLGEHDVEWAEVARKRLEGIRSGERQTIPWADVQRRLLAE